MSKTHAVRFFRWTTWWWPLPVSNSSHVGLFAVAKDEGPWLIPWVAHHKALGFDPIAIATNDCSDGTDDIASRLAELGEIIHLDNPPPYDILNDEGIHSIQLTGYDRLAREMDLEVLDWLAIFDLDEFLALRPPYSSVQDLVSASENLDAICLRWRVFGDNGTRGYVGDKIIELQTRAAEFDHPANADFKAIVRAPARFEAHLHISYRPLGYSLMTKVTRWVVDLCTKFTLRRVSLDGDIHSLPGNRLFKRVRTRFAKHPKPYAFGQVNHYAVKSRAHFELKKKRGRGNSNHSRRHGNWFYRTFNRNEVMDNLISRHSALSNAEVERLLKDPDLARLHRATETFTKARISKLEAAGKIEDEQP